MADVGPLNALPLSEVVSRLAARFGPDLASRWITPYNAAYAVGAALSQERPAATNGAPGVSAVEALGALSLLSSARDALDKLEATLIEAILDRGVTWDQLGSAYGGRTRQTMQQLYRRRGGTRSWGPGRFPSLSAVADGDSAGPVVSRAVAEVKGTWQVSLRRGAHPGDEVLREVLPVVLRLENLDLHSIRRPWPDWLARDRTLPRRVRSAVRSFDRISDTGSTVVIRAGTEAPAASATPDVSEQQL